ncbi:beta-ketoacyl synthase N-terminal-like domain-containing protein [Parachitinimonas caeni]|uniref:Beta-ketoacyl synthase N-terminal-like domain-containing protein n=1 Tax=Parachitinimonas caeni TaxID=3031301 RepID=A0ABT7DRS6_9NEIS|nr:polyketide synthase [Parachitinimonas caeni]MDK2122756.1 beta-ketoacyl synthase N-terminal-like domain-containing protein [Parachitinimonas caeni]
MAAQRPIAIIGIGCRFPSADGLEAFWQNLIDGRDCVGPVPAERWEASRFGGEKAGEPGTTYCPNVGMDASGDCHDAAFFGIDPEEARRMDPQQGSVLEMAWHACEDANLPPDSLAGRDVGVFIGVSTRDFDRRMSGLWQHVDVRTSTGAAGAIVANRLSYLFGLTGPSVAIDGACASSLASVHMACRALDDEECSLALAGGIQLILSPANIIAFSQGGLLAKDGHCKPFSAQADGYVCGEGGGLLLLKPLELALRDGDPIRAVIRGSAINHNGRSNGMAAPYRAGQLQVLCKALARAGIEPASVDYVEAHAPGTLIGDAIELQAIRDVYGAQRPAGRPCFVGSVKSNIGHLEAAAGIASLIKASLAVERGILPASLHSQPASPLLKLGSDEAPGSVCLSSHTRLWPLGSGPRRAGVSAFSFGGGNAHLLVEQAPDPTATTPNASPPLWLLAVSARSDAAFQQLCADYAERLQQLQQQAAPLAMLGDFCRSSLLGRQHHSWRQAWVVSSWSEAIHALRQASPLVAGNRQCRIGVIAATSGGALSLPGHWHHLLADLAPARSGPPEILCLVALLKRLGLSRLHLASSSPLLGQLGDFASQIGLNVIGPDQSPPRAGDCPSLIDASQNDSTGDLLWQPAHGLPTAALQLACQLYQRHFKLDWQPFVALSGRGSHRLPLYPFERARHYRIADALSLDADANADALPYLLKPRD